MRCYDTTKCAVNPVQLRLLTRRQNMGFIDPATALAAIKNVFNFFGKDPDKAQYDQLRQQLWIQFKDIVDTVDSLHASGQLSSTVLLDYIQTVESTMRELTSLTDQMRTRVESSWLDPRYHDFYDFMKRVVDSWRLNLLPTLHSSGVLSMMNTATSGSGIGVLLAGGLLVFGLSKMGRRHA